jgi:hypothetical protein
VRIGKPNALSKWRVSLGPAPKHYKKLGRLGKALNPIHIHPGKAQGRHRLQLVPQGLLQEVVSA